MLKGCHFYCCSVNIDKCHKLRIFFQILNFHWISLPQPRVSNHERRMEKRMDGVRTRAVCISGINPPSCFFPLVVFRGGGFCYCCGSKCQRPTGGAESPDKVAARGRIKPRLLTPQWRVLVPPDVPVEGLSHRRSASTVCWPLTNSLTVRLRLCPPPPPAVTIYSLCRTGAGKLYRLLGHNGF